LLTQVAAILAHGEPLSLELVGCRVFTTPEKKRSSLTYQYQFTNAWVVAAITIDTVGSRKRVVGINVNPLPHSLGELNAFTLSGKNMRHYVLLVLVVLVPILIVWVVVLCARAKIRRKWLWIIFIVIGIAQLNLNWTTGQMRFVPLAFQVLGAGMVKKGIYAPWNLAVSFPLGAIVFLIRRRSLQSAKEQSDTEQSPAEATS